MKGIQRLLCLLSNQDVIHDHNHEGNEKRLIQNNHSTDTEPEHEIDNLQQHEFAKPQEDQSRLKKKTKNVFTRLIQKIPSYEYDLPKKQRISSNKNCNNKDSDFVPLDIRNTDNNRFASYYDAFFYIAGHCKKYHDRFTREKCRQYLQYCYIIDFSHDEFIPITLNLTPKEFNKYFQMAQRDLKYI